MIVNQIAKGTGGGVSSGVSWDSIDGSYRITSATVYGTIIPLRAFYNQAFITSITLPAGLTRIDSNAFYGCVSMVLATLPSGITVISDNAFYSCTNLSLTSLPSGITSIAGYTFKNCSNLAITKLPNGVTSIATYAFQGCTSLTKLWIPISCTTISASAYTNAPFYQCSSSLELYCEAESKPAGWGTYWNYYGSGAQLTVNWGVSESEFDAL